jgi:hypothetical protein
MSDDEFRREFLRILNMYKGGMDSYMKKFYGGDNNFSNNIGGVNEEDIFKKFFGQMPDDMNIERGIDDDGSDWESKEWSSPDGLSGFRSYRRHNFTNPMLNRHMEEDELDTVEVLNKRLRKAVDEEKYEEASKIHKLIKQLNEED